MDCINDYLKCYSDIKQYSKIDEALVILELRSLIVSMGKKIYLEEWGYNDFLMIELVSSIKNSDSIPDYIIECYLSLEKLSKNEQFSNDLVYTAPNITSIIPTTKELLKWYLDRYYNYELNE